MIQNFFLLALLQLEVIEKKKWIDEDSLYLLQQQTFSISSMNNQYINKHIGRQWHAGEVIRMAQENEIAS